MKYLLGLVRHAQACPTLSKTIKHQYLWEGLSYFVYLLHIVTHPWKLQFYHIVLVGYEINSQCLWKGLSDFVDFLHAIICILLDIHWSYKNMLLLGGILKRRFSANQIFRCFKLKKLENYKWYQVDFLLPLKPQKMSVSRIFDFDLFDLLILILGVHCYIVLV